jgi:hypothetical protein
MIRVGNNSISPAVPQPSAQGVVSAATAAETSPIEISDQVELSHELAAVPQDRANRIAALKAELASPDYLPESLPVSRKLVSGALSRTE